MESPAAVERLFALAQTTRLGVFRLLVRAGPDGLRAGEIAERLGVPANTLSTHLGVLSAAGLIVMRPASRERVYSARFEVVTELVAYLVEDCCAGEPKLCADLAEILVRTRDCAPACGA